MSARVRFAARLSAAAPTLRPRAARSPFATIRTWLFSLLFTGFAAVGVCGEIVITPTWSGAGEDDSIGTAANWLEGSLPISSSTTDVVFGNVDGGAPQSVLIPFGLSLRNLTFSGDARPTYSFVGDDAPTLSLHGNIAVGSGGDVVFADSLAILLAGSSQTIDVADGVTVSVAGTIGGSVGFTKSGSGNLILSGANTYAGETTITGGTLTISSDENLGAAPESAAPGNLVLDGGTVRTTETFELHANRGIDVQSSGTLSTDASTTLTYGGIITGDTLVKTGAGTLLLSGANTYDGGTLVEEGRLELAATGSLADGADLTLTGTSIFSLAGEETIRGLFADAESGSGSSVELQGEAVLTVNLPDPDTDPDHSSSTFAGALTGAGSLVKTGPGTLTLSGASDHSGGTKLVTGTLVVAHNDALGVGPLTFFGNGTLEPNGSRTFANAIEIDVESTTTIFAGSNLTLAGSISGDGEIVKAGLGTLTLTGGNGDFGGALCSSGGTVKLGSISARGLGDWTFESTSVLEIIVEGTSDDSAISGDTETYFYDTAQLKAQKSYAITGGYQSFQDGAALVARDPNAVAGGIQDFYADAEPDGLESADATTFRDFLTSLDDGEVGVYLKSTARLTINSDGSVSGGEQYFDGTASLQANTSFAVSGGEQAFFDRTHLRASQPNSIVGGYQEFFDYSFLWATADDAVTGGMQDFYDHAGAYANATHSFNGASLYLEDSAFIKLGATDALSDDTDIYFSGYGVGEGGRLVLNGFSTTVGEIRSGTDTEGNPNPGIIENAHASTPATLTIGRSESIHVESYEVEESDPVFAGIIQDGTESAALSIAKVGDDTLTLSGPNTYSGTTTLAGGTLRLGTSDVLPDTTTVIFDTDVGAILDLDGFSEAIARVIGGGPTSELRIGSGELTVGDAQNGTFDGIVTGSGSLTKTGTGQLTLREDSPFIGSITVDAGTLALGDGGTSGGIDGNIHVAGGATLISYRSDATTYSGVLSGVSTSTIIKDGEGTLTLTGNSNGFAGLAEIQMGGVLLDGSIAGTTEVLSGAFLGGSGHVGVLILKTGATLSPGGDDHIGTLHAGSTTLEAGSIFAFDLNGTSGSAGTNWDLLSVTGQLTLGAGATTNKIFIDVNALTPLSVATFNNSVAHSWQFVTTTSGINGFSANAFTFDPLPFSGSLDVSLGSSGHALLLNFTPVPEPSTWALMIAGGGMLAVAALRRRRGARQSPRC